MSVLEVTYRLRLRFSLRKRTHENTDLNDAVGMNQNKTVKPGSKLFGSPQSVAL
jgi:hypothetical protein